MAKLLAFYDSAEYATLKSLRMHASDSRIIAVEDTADPSAGGTPSGMA
jgi:uncharacterized protein (DUF1330 family)